MRRGALPATALVVLLAGCGPLLPIPGPGTLEDAIEQETGGEIDLGGVAAVPADWPAELPLPDGDLLAAIAVDGTHTLNYRVADESIGERLVENVTALGFAAQGAVDHGQLVSHTLVREGWTIVIGWLVADDEVTLTYMSSAR